ncbi:MAG: hypothetical protein QOI01_7055, partial [Mycobacterium sp.]|nr:hypothetical protein [Mycobacterium sp.]
FRPARSVASVGAKQHRGGGSPPRTRLRADHRGRDQPTAPPSAGLSSTVITLGRGETRGPAPDLRSVQTSQSTVRVSSADRTMDLAIVAFRQEQAWTG